MHTHTHTHTCTHTHTYIKNTHAHSLSTQAHTYTHAHTHTHTHSSTIMPTKDSPATCPVLERVLSGAPAGISVDLLKSYQTLVLHSIMDYLQKGNEDIMITFKESHFTGSIEHSLRYSNLKLVGFHLRSGEFPPSPWDAYCPLSNLAYITKFCAQPSACATCTFFVAYFCLWKVF